MKKIYLVLSIVVLLTANHSIKAEQFDYDFIKTMRGDLPKAQVENILTVLKIPYHFQNNNEGGKNICLDSIGFKIFGFKPDLFMFDFNNGTMNSMLMYFKDDSANDKFFKFMDSISNCRYYIKNEMRMRFVLDNAIISIPNDKKDFIQIMSVKMGCK